MMFLVLKVYYLIGMQRIYNKFLITQVLRKIFYFISKLSFCKLQQNKPQTPTYKWLWLVLNYFKDCKSTIH